MRLKVHVYGYGWGKVVKVDRAKIEGLDDGTAVDERRGSARVGEGGCLAAARAGSA